MLLQVQHDQGLQLPGTSSIPAASHTCLADSDAVTSTMNIQEVVSVPDPFDECSMIDFCVPRFTQASTASLQATSLHISSMQAPYRCFADACQPLWRPSTGQLQKAFANQTAGLVQEISNRPSPALPCIQPPATVQPQPLQALASLVESLRSNLHHPDVHSRSDGQSGAKETQMLGGYTFCGKPTKVACWLSDLCQYLPGQPISDSQLWALGSGTHLCSPVRLAGLKQLCK